MTGVQTCALPISRRATGWIVALRSGPRVRLCALPRRRGWSRNLVCRRGAGRRRIHRLVLERSIGYRSAHHRIDDELFARWRSALHVWGAAHSCGSAERRRPADSASYSAFVVAPFPAGFSAFGEADFTAPFAVERLAPFVTPVVPAGFGAAAFAAFGVALFFAADLAVRFAGASTAVPPAATRAAFFARRDLRRAAEIGRAHV